MLYGNLIGRAEENDQDAASFVYVRDFEKRLSLKMQQQIFFFFSSIRHLFHNKANQWANKKKYMHYIE